MKAIATEIPGVLIFESPVFRDLRGSFQELFSLRGLKELGVDIDWKQDNLSVSQNNVIRGLHYQIVQPQAKFVQVVRGAVFDVAVDLRRTSPTFGRHVSVELKAGDGKAFFIPVGFAHGFAALEPETAFLYKVSDYYAPEGDRTVLWNDPELGIDWRVRPEDAVVSAKDQAGTPLRNAEVFA